MLRASMKDYWDARADERALFFVDSRVTYGAPNEAQFWSEGRRAIDSMLRELGVELGEHDVVVEIGCGVGRMTRVLAGGARTVKAIDVSERMLELAREHNAGLSNVEWILGDGSTLGMLETASADACISAVVFQHLPEPALTLGYVSEIGRVLRPGGWAAINFSNDPSIHRRRSPLARAAGGLRAVIGRGPRGQGHPAWLGSAVELERLRATAAESGLEIEAVRGAGTQFCRALLRRG